MGVYRPLGSGVIGESGGTYIGEVCPIGFIESLGPGGNAGPIANGNRNSTRDFSYFMGPIARRVSGVIGEVWAFRWGSSPKGLSNYWIPAGKRGRSRTVTGNVLCGVFSYFIGSIARWVWGVIGEASEFIWEGVCPTGLLNSWTPVGKRARSRTGAVNLLGGDFSYCMGLSPAGFGALSEMCGHLFGAVFPGGFMELLDSGGRAVPIENGNWNPTGWKLQLFHGVYRPLVFGRYRGVVAIFLGGPVPMSY